MLDPSDEGEWLSRWLDRKSMLELVVLALVLGGPPELRQGLSVLAAELESGRRQLPRE